MTDIVTDQDIDDLTKQRLENERERSVPAVGGLAHAATHLVQSNDGEHPFAHAQRHMVGLGLFEVAIEDGRLSLVSSNLGFLAGHMHAAGLAPTDITQILRYAWETISEEVPHTSYFQRSVLFVNASAWSIEVRDQCVRLLQWCLDELVLLVTERSSVPTLAWFVMEMALDLASRVMPESPSE
jgi:hypothetical protein